jgi:UDP-N-acetylmuramoyl-L-alanyl-D-glutamate--2,6-diaminopimelate ligase
VRWHDLLASLDVLERAHDADVEITSITEDSRRVTPGACFACRAGLAVDGHEHAEDARAAGAVALLVERLLQLPIPQARVASVPRVLGRAAATLYGNPSRSMRCLGITGTAGKSTTAALLASIARAAGEHTGFIGNDGVFVDGVALEVEKWGGTNMPQADQLQLLLAGMLDRGVRTVAMEVTSRALDFGRVDATWFAAACFTNLSHEHLDDHGSMESYFAAKRNLFDP